MTLTLMTSRSVHANERHPSRPRRRKRRGGLAILGGCLAALAVAVPASPAAPVSRLLAARSMLAVSERHES
jgi:ferric-dicitrate binding protein FerR (iron transport regulator)